MDNETKDVEKRSCEICGADIPPRTGRGRQAKICGSAECKAERVRRHMRAYYNKIKQTPEYQAWVASPEYKARVASPEYKAKQAKRYRDIRARVASDPEYSEVWHAQLRERARRERQRRDSDPVLRQQYLEKERERAKRRRNEEREHIMPRKSYASVRDVLEDTSGADENMKVRSELMLALCAQLKQSGMTQAQAARRWGVASARVSGLVNGKINFFSLDTLFRMAAKAGLRVRVSIQADCNNEAPPA